MFYQLYHHIKNKYFEELQEKSAAIREAMIFQRTLEEMPIAIIPKDSFAGWYGYIDKCELTEVYDNKKFDYLDAYTVEDRAVLKELKDNFGMWLGFDTGHTCIDYGHIINYGLVSYVEKVKEEMKKNNSEDKRILLDAMLISLMAVHNYAKRYAILAQEQMKCTVGKNKEHLEKIYKTMSKVPYLPSENFYEALSAIWIMHTVIAISDNSWASISLGRLDQYLYPFYKKENEKEKLREYLKEFFLLLNSYGDGACALNVGGMDKDGNDQMNELSALLIEVEKEICMSSPILAIRVSPNTSEEILDNVIDKKLFSIGQPTFYGELPCRNAMICRGLPEEEAVDFSINSCMGLFMSGEEVASMWGCVFNMHLPLELAINRGKPLFSSLPFELQLNSEHSHKNREIDSLETLWDVFENYLESILVKLFELNRKSEINYAVNNPNPLLSALTTGCIESGRDRAIGAKYVTETVETMGFANTANAIVSIDTLVFKQNKYTLDQIINAVKQDFVDSEMLLRDIRMCDKYGTNSVYADGICRRLCEITAKVCKKLSFDNVYYLPSMHTLESNVAFGRNLYTTIDGRMKGEPVNKNAGPTNDVRGADFTNIVLSASSLNQQLFSGGQPIDLYFTPNILDRKEGRDKIKALIKTYFQLGGLQLQVNSIDVELLEKAYENPKEYPHVIVRIGGYSQPFCNLAKEVQREFIDRFRSESA